MVGKTKDGQIYYFVRYKDRQGKRKQRRITNKDWKTLKEARQAEEEFLASLVDEPVKSIKNYSDLLNEYIEHHRTIDKLITIKTAQYLQEAHILPTFGKLSIQDITPSKIDSWQQRLLKSGYKNSYLKQIQSHFKRVLQFGKVYDYIADNPFYRPFVKRKETTVKMMNFYTLDEFNQFISVVDDPVYKAIFETLYWCGLRKGELLALRVKDVDFNKNIIHVYKTYDQRHKKETTPKNKNGFRDIVFTDRVKEALINLRDYYSDVDGYNTDCYMFGYHYPVTFTTLDRKNREYAAAAKVKRIRIHDFRHSHASFLINNGFNQFEIAKRMGHTVAELTETYSHWFIESQNDMVKEMNSLEEANKKTIINDIKRVS